jgi:hypothetical protein
VIDNQFDIGHSGGGTDFCLDELNLPVPAQNFCVGTPAPVTDGLVAERRREYRGFWTFWSFKQGHFWLRFDWLALAAPFSHLLPSLFLLCRATGFIPGIRLAPGWGR